MYKINYKSDFDFLLQLLTHDGEDIGWPGWNWRAKLWTTSKANAYEVGCRDGEAVNCYNDNGRIHVVVNSHVLSAGRLMMELVAELPQEIYPDGAERVAVPVALDIELIKAAAPCPEGIDITVETPWQYIHDTDVYAEILRKVNAALDDILGEGGGTAAPSRKAAASSRAVRVQRGMMRTTAEPGVVYDCYKRSYQFDYGRDTGYVLSPWIENGVWWDYSTAFPGGMFYGQPISFYNQGEHDVENHRVKGLSARITVILKLPTEDEEHDTYRHYLTTDTDGRVVCAAITGKVERTELPTDFVLDKLRDVDESDGDWADATATDGSRLELQWYVRRRGRSNGRRQSLDFFDKGRFRRIKKVSRGGRQNLGVFRVRRHTNRGYRSAWVYYTRRGNSIVRIQK